MIIVRKHGWNIHRVLLSGTQCIFQPWFATLDSLIIYCFTYCSIICHWHCIWRSQHCRWRTANIYAYVRRSWPLRKEGSVSCHSCCVTGPLFFWSRPTGRPIQSPLTTHNGTWKIYSDSDPHGSHSVASYDTQWDAEDLLDGFTTMIQNRMIHDIHTRVFLYNIYSYTLTQKLRTSKF
jgi:hypothetical protein